MILDPPDLAEQPPRSRRERRRAEAPRGRRRAAAAAEQRPQDAPDGPRRRWRLWRSSLLRRVLAVNLVMVAVPVVGLLYLKQYRESLIQAELEALRTQARVFSLALGSTSVLADNSGRERLVPELTRHQLHLLLTQTGLRARLYGPLPETGGGLLVDSYQLGGPDAVMQVRPLDPPGDRDLWERLVAAIDRLFTWLPGVEDLPPYDDGRTQTALDYPEVLSALVGENSGTARRDSAGRMVLSVAVPVQRYRQVLGALLLTKDGSSIETAVAERRVDVLYIFAVAGVVSVLLSLYLAGTIARPIRTLARAADRVKSGKGKKITLPDYSRRGDEIGELGRALKEMTDVLWARLDAIEGFAADVAHEIKNPLTSLKSAVETVVRLKDPERQKKLMAIILDDVARLDRLITDISDASRLDAELARAEAEPVEIGRLLEALAEVHRAAFGETGPQFDLAFDPAAQLTAVGLEGRLGQVFRNVIVNAMSFSPPGGTIRLGARRIGNRIVATVDDEGPGIPPGKETAIFDRFYSERPESEKFGTHSGLGLSISRQIVEAHGGVLRAENRVAADGRVLGARFTVELPVWQAPPTGRTRRA